MEELAKLEAERGTPGYTLDGTVKNSGAEAAVSTGVAIVFCKIMDKH